MDPPRRGGSCKAAEGVEKPCIPAPEKDFSTHRSCSGFGSILKQHAATSRNDGERDGLIHQVYRFHRCVSFRLSSSRDLTIHPAPLVRPFSRGCMIGKELRVTLRVEVQRLRRRMHHNLPSLEGRGTACGGGVPIEAPQATEGAFPNVCICIVIRQKWYFSAAPHGWGRLRNGREAAGSQLSLYSIIFIYQRKPCVESQVRRYRNSISCRGGHSFLLSTGVRRPSYEVAARFLLLPKACNNYIL